MDQMNRLVAALKTLFTETADELARQLGVIRRQRIFSGSSLVQTLVFGWLHQPQATGDQMAQMAALCHAPVTEQALEKRYTPAAALKVQVQWDLVGGALRGLPLEPGQQPDPATTRTPRSLPAGARRIADLGDFDVTDLAAMDRRGVSFLSRIQVGTAVFDAHGQRLDVGTWLGRQKTAVVDVPIRLGSQERLACRLVALRCSAEVVRKRRQRLRRTAAQKGCWSRCMPSCWASWRSSGSC